MNLFVLFRPLNQFRTRLRSILRFGISSNTEKLYKQVFVLKSLNHKLEENNERLEFLGDAILNTIIAEFLFKKYPRRNEGFLSEMRSKIVNRQNLNSIGYKLQLYKFINSNGKHHSLDATGNIIEALIGAIYLDKGYTFTAKWVYVNIIFIYLDLAQIELVDINIKNKIYSWGIKNNKTIKYVVLNEAHLKQGKDRLFVIGVFANDEQITSASGRTKKEAEINAAHMAYNYLSI